MRWTSCISGFSDRDGNQHPWPSFHTYAKQLFQTFDLNEQALSTAKHKSTTIHNVRTSLQKHYTLYYEDKLNKSEKLLYYKHIKRPYTTATYLNTVKNANFRRALTKIRICAHRLEIETGRYHKTAQHDRLCKLCSTSVEDELHFLLHCPRLEERRYLLTTKLSTTYPIFSTLNDMD
jgi:hypothetical protein